MKCVAGIDVGSTYTKSVVFNPAGDIIGKAMLSTGFRLGEAARKACDKAMEDAEIGQEDVGYVISTGYGRHQVDFGDVTVTALTAAARGAHWLFPETRTVLDIGGQTMKATKLDENIKVKSFRLNDKCAAGTGAFLEKTARYMSYETEEIGDLAASSNEEVDISGVCAVFAESEVINQLSIGSAPSDIMHGAMLSLMARSLQLMRRIKMEPEYTLIGGIMRFPTMVESLTEKLGDGVNVPEGDLVQYVGAIGAATLAMQRIEKLRAQ
ncbi:MAG: acyl-CoA dehydratase activase [Candidatus Thalassarchaeaceae archaeon]|jgi:predicted CoA-substrate-specific enzyme activase|nr:2-hydroxyglutaryl-CoA dehydratase [Euryarchaeota archaeon]MDP7091919.1 acyl-CoA dehydratase activase [Candidatus Thalassarchaeaceae archaeon]MBV43429.1 2-hydroxyglutaryl-CoA dehydratase [Euryarchaeota archaeon]MDP7256839.1 acyl-CoA dehydratase activase [Candidatus Thalassarchaeaceae archaeon]MDP7446079.1 acyl-CoA dehydratase activase [Candidatus Thalassarchaeaceae archaeon]|tara:strand:- start:54096 stop:54896 length:801 start_codon:yes stop_codon:yes gene_type:complete